MNLGSIVLAGGRGRRMGGAKESLLFQDNSLLGHTVDLLLTCTHPVVVVARAPDQELPPLPPEAEVVYDQVPDRGPLMGLKAGLEFLQEEGECDAAFLAGCDNPFLSLEAVSWMADQLGEHDLVMAAIGGTPQPLSAVYRLGVLVEVDKLLEAEVHALQALRERVKTRLLTEAEVDAFDPERRFLRNLNSPDEYEAARREVEPEPAEAEEDG